VARGCVKCVFAVPYESDVFILLQLWLWHALLILLHIKQEFVLLTDVIIR